MFITLLAVGIVVLYALRNRLEVELRGGDHAGVFGPAGARTHVAAKPMTGQPARARCWGSSAFFLLALPIVVWSVGAVPVDGHHLRSSRTAILAAVAAILPTEIAFSHYSRSSSSGPSWSSSTAPSSRLPPLDLPGHRLLAGYAFGRLHFPARLALLLTVLVVSMFPQIFDRGPALIASSSHAGC